MNENKLYKGYLRTDGKVAKMKFKNADLLNLDVAKQLSGYAGVLRDDVVLIDIDDKEQSEKLINIVEKLQLNCRVTLTNRGRHFVFKNSKNVFEKCCTHKKNAIGLECDVKVGTKNQYQILKIDNEERFVEWDIADGDEYDDVPKWLSVANFVPDFMNLDVGDGRNEKLFSYILSLQSAGFTKEEARDCLKIVNEFIFSQPLDDNELEIILRDESFQKEVFFKKNVFLFDKFAEFIKNNNHIIKINGQLYVYHDGCYIPNTKLIENLMIKHISLKKAQRAEVLNYLELIVPENEIPINSNYVCFNNGIYDVANDVTIEYSPDIIVTNKINYDYRADAYNELLDKTLNKIACNDAEIRSLLEECAGYCFFKRNELGKAFILTGEKSNGKSTYLDLIKQMLGENNVSSLDLSELSERFSTAMLYGKLANIGDDIGDEFIANTSYFKKIVTGNRIKAERKGTDPFEFNPYVKMMFSCNSIPRMGKGRDSAAIIRRLVVIPFNARFSKDDPDYDPFIKYKLQQKESIEYLVKLGIDGLKRVLANNDFTKSNKVIDEVNSYELENNPTKLFFADNDVLKIKNQIANEVYLKYQLFCEEYGLNAIGNIAFSKQCCKEYGLEVQSKRINGKTKRIFVDKTK